jgi:hypothetical protein
MVREVHTSYVVPVGVVECPVMDDDKVRRIVSDDVDVRFQSVCFHARRLRRPGLTRRLTVQDPKVGHSCGPRV